MKAHEPVNFDEALKTELDSLFRYTREKTEQAASMRKYQKLVETLSIFYDARVSLLNTGIEVSIYVHELKDVEPAIKLCEMNGVVFKSSNDLAEWRQRTFSAGEFVLSASTLEDTENCKRVQVGVREVPVYKMECEEPQTGPLLG